MELKHEILSASSCHPEAERVFSPSLLAKVKDYVSKGVFYVESSPMEVSLDM